MFQYLEKLRKKPEGERRKTVLLISLGVTLIIALIWIITITSRIGSTNFSLEDETGNEKIGEKVPSLTETFSNFMDQVGNIINNSTTYDSATTTKMIQ
ncbi:MAG: hypothetical protein Q7R72_02145 [bacterium]|nr:hypothetical protein [bacterium]